MGISWTAALRLYGKQKGHFIVPRKGSPEYDAVKKLQMETEMSEEHAVKPRAKKGGEKKTKDAPEPMAAPPAPAPPSRGRGSEGSRRKGHASPVRPHREPSPADVPPPAGPTKAVDVPNKPTRRTRVIRKPTAAPEPEKKGVQTSGLPKVVELEQAETDTAYGLSDPSVSFANADQKMKVRRAITRKLEGDELERDVEPHPEDKTTASMKIRNEAVVEGQKPFSFVEFRRRILS